MVQNNLSPGIQPPIQPFDPQGAPPTDQNNVYVPNDVQVFDLGNFLTDLLFPTFLNPYIELLENAAWGAMAPFVASADYVSRACNAVAEVFSRIIFSPEFDPRSDEFANQLITLSQQVNTLSNEINSLKTKFKEPKTMIGDTLHFYKVANEIDEKLELLERYLRVIQLRNDLPIKTSLTNVRDDYTTLQDQLNVFCKANAIQILNIYETVVNKFTKSGMKLPEELRKPLIENWETLNKAIIPRWNLLSYAAQSKHEKLQTDMSSVINGTTQSVREPEKPLPLLNIGNSCYLDAMLQCYLCIKGLEDSLRQPLIFDKNTTDEERKHMRLIQNELRLFFDGTPPQEVPNLFEFALSLMSSNKDTSEQEASLYRLRDRIFDSKLHLELKRGGKDGIEAQHDAAYIAELLTQYIFSDFCKFSLKESRTVPEFPGIEFNMPNQDMFVFQMNFKEQVPPPPNTKPDNNVPIPTLSEMMNENFEKLDCLDDGFTYKLEDKGVAKVVDENLEKTILDRSSRRVAKYNRKYTIDALPNIMTLHLKRFTVVQNRDKKSHSTQKLYDPVVLPQDGIVDCSKYCQGQSNGRYEMISYVQHDGGLHGGHYISFAKIGDKYYKCDDFVWFGNPYEEITKEEFLSNKNAYMIVLQRLPDNTVPPVPTVPVTSAPIV